MAVRCPLLLPCRISGENEPCLEAFGEGGEKSNLYEFEFTLIEGNRTERAKIPSCFSSMLTGPRAVSSETLRSI